MSLLGLRDIVSGARPLPEVAIALSSFRGAESIRSSPEAEIDDAPANFVQGHDDISNDVFFGKRDTMLANQMAAALHRVGFRYPLYVEDRVVWEALAHPDSTAGGPLVLRQYGEEHTVGIVVAVGLWSNLLVTGMADWDSFPEFQMTGDPTNHATRTIRFCEPTGLRILDLNASPETDELGGNPAIIVTRRLAGLHAVLVGGATSLSTLRLAELLAEDDIWRALARRASGPDPSRHSAGGSWVAIECPNAPEWKDRCRVVKTDLVAQSVDQSLSDLRRSPA